MCLSHRDPFSWIGQMDGWSERYSKHPSVICGNFEKWVHKFHSLLKICYIFIKNFSFEIFPPFIKSTLLWSVSSKLIIYKDNIVCFGNFFPNIFSPWNSLTFFLRKCFSGLFSSWKQYWGEIFLGNFLLIKKNILKIRWWIMNCFVCMWQWAFGPTVRLYCDWIVNLLMTIFLTGIQTQ